jgi:hypothetical protein
MFIALGCPLTGYNPGLSLASLDTNPEKTSLHNWADG